LPCILAARMAAPAATGGLVQRSLKFGFIHGAGAYRSIDNVNKPRGGISIDR
jgi:hypothetical protein